MIFLCDSELENLFKHDFLISRVYNIVGKLDENSTCVFRSHLSY